MVLIPTLGGLLFHYQRSLSHNHLYHSHLCNHPYHLYLYNLLDLLGHSHEDQLEELIGLGHPFYDELMEAWWVSEQGC